MPQEITIEELGQKFKAKYPGSDYGKFSDKEIGQKVLEKYPEYHAILKREPKEDGVLRSLARGVKDVVTQVPKLAVQLPRAVVAGAAGLAGLAGSETGKRIEKQFASPVNVPGLGEVGALTAYPIEGAMTPRQIGAQALELAASRVPGSKGIVGGILGGVKSGALSSAAESVKQGGDARDVAMSSVAGGISGGAIGSVFPTVSAAATSFQKLVRPTNTQLLFSAIKPSSANLTFARDARVVMNELEPQASSIKTLNDLDSAIRGKKASLWSEVISKVSKADRDTNISLDGAAYKMQQMSQKPIFKINNPQISQKLQEQSRQLRATKLSPMEAEDVLEDLNARHEAYYRKNNTTRAAAEKADPELAAELAIADDLRRGLDGLIEGLGDVKRRYGALSSVGKEVSKRIPVAERQNLSSLSEQISGARTVGNVLGSLGAGQPMSAAGQAFDYLTAKGLRALDESDAKISRAFSRAGKKKILPTDVSEGLSRAVETVAPVMRGGVGLLERGAQMSAGRALSSPKPNKSR